MTAFDSNYKDLLGTELILISASVASLGIAQTAFMTMELGNDRKRLLYRKEMNTSKAEAHLAPFIDLCSNCAL
jgi:hypothetical protein